MDLVWDTFMLMLAFALQQQSISEVDNNTTEFLRYDIIDGILDEYLPKSFARNMKQYAENSSINTPNSKFYELVNMMLISFDLSLKANDTLGDIIVVHPGPARYWLSPPFSRKGHLFMIKIKINKDERHFTVSELKRR